MKFKLFNNLKIGAKLGIGMGFVLCLMLLAIFTFQRTLDKVGKGYHDMLTHEYAIQDHAHEVNEFMLQCRRNEKDFLLRHKKKYTENMSSKAKKTCLPPLIFIKHHGKK